MSRRPQSTPSRPKGSTGANSAKSVPARLARCRAWNLSPYPRKTKNQVRTDRANRRRKW